MEYSSKWNTPIIKMEHSYYYQNGTHQNGTLILLSKWNSSKRNTHQKGTLISKWNTHPILPYLALVFPFLGFVPSGLGFEWNSPHQQAMDYRMELSSLASHGLS